MGSVALPFVGMMMAECAQVGLMIVGKQAMARGMSNLVFIFYSNAFASLILLPTSFLFHRSTDRPPLSFSILSGFFVLSLLGFVVQILGYLGILYSSPTLGTAMLNLIPAFTFILAVIFGDFPLRGQFYKLGSSILFTEKMSAEQIMSSLKLKIPILKRQQTAYAAWNKISIVIHFLLLIQLGVFRMEKLDWKSSSSLAKSMGTMVSIAGAFIVTLYKGLPLLMSPSPTNSSHQLFVQMSIWVIGGLLLAVNSVLSSAWLFVQALMLKKYPAELIVVCFYCFFVAIQSAVVCLVVERDLSSWSLQSNERLIAVLYSAVFGSAFQVGISAWCLHKTGPVFVAMFKPLGIVISVVVGVILLRDTFYLGSLIGAIVIIIGFYSVMWGKAKEKKMSEKAGVRSLESSGEKVPLLQNSIEEM